MRPASVLHSVGLLRGAPAEGKWVSYGRLSGTAGIRADSLSLSMKRSPMNLQTSM